MENADFDVVIVGAGVIGCSVARYLSKYKAKVLVIERHNDVGEETSKANSAIVHSGYDPLPGTKKAYFNVKGNKMMEQVCEELDVPFKKIGSLTVAFNDEEIEALNELMIRASKNDVDAKIIDHDELLKMEPNLNPEAKRAIFCKDAGIVSPFNLCVNLMENAMNNEVKLHLNEEVKDIKHEDDLYKVITDKGEYVTRSVVNASGLHSDEIAHLVGADNFRVIPRKGEYYVLDHFDDNWIKHTLFLCPTKVGKGVLVSPTTSGDYIIGPSNEDNDKTDTSTHSDVLRTVKETALKLVPNIPFGENIRQFSGIRANSSVGDFVIEESLVAPGFINLGAIMSPGLASSLAIGEYTSELLAKKFSFEEDKNFNPYIKKHYSLKKMGYEEYKQIISNDPRYGHMVCRCEKVSEGEIVDCIHRNCGATTVKGVKKRVRPGFGKCQGTFCQEEVIKILARELHKDIGEICYSEQGTEIMKFDVKGHDYGE